MSPISKALQEPTHKTSEARQKAVVEEEMVSLKEAREEYRQPERFRQKIQAERAAEKDAYETKFKREQAAAEAAEAAKTAEAAP